jgi:hypothetical protein
MVASSIPVEILFGIYLGVLTGIVPALIAGALGFAFKYVTDVSIPGFGIVALALTIAGVNGGVLALADPAIVEAENNVALLVAIVVVLMLTLYAHAQGDKLGAAVPRRFTLQSIAERTLSTDVVELVGGRGQVRVRVAGDVDDLEGYPPLSADLRTAIRDGEWTFPADLPLGDLETRLADRLREDYDLADVSVRLDERGRATVAAAPPVGGLSKRVPDGRRAVSVDALLPTGLAPGDEVRVLAGDGPVPGLVLGVRAAGADGDGEGGAPGPTAGDGVATDGGAEAEPGTGSGAPATPVRSATGGEGRVTLAVERRAAETVLRATAPRVVVEARGTRREFELATLLRRAGQRVRRVTVREGGPLDGASVRAVGVRETYGVGVLATKRENERWRFEPDEAAELAAGTELFVAGEREALDAFEEVAA